MRNWTKRVRHLILDPDYKQISRTVLRSDISEKELYYKDYNKMGTWGKSVLFVYCYMIVLHLTVLCRILCYVVYVALCVCLLCDN